MCVGVFPIYLFSLRIRLLSIFIILEIENFLCACCCVLISEIDALHLGRVELLRRFVRMHIRARADLTGILFLFRNVGGLLPWALLRTQIRFNSLQVNLLEALQFACIDCWCFVDDIRPDWSVDLRSAIAVIVSTQGTSLPELILPRTCLIEMRNNSGVSSSTLASRIRINRRRIVFIKVLNNQIIMSLCESVCRRSPRNSIQWRLRIFGIHRWAWNARVLQTSTLFRFILIRRTHWFLRNETTTLIRIIHHTDCIAIPLARPRTSFSTIIVRNTVTSSSLHLLLPKY